MTDKETLFTYRLREAEETLDEATRMIEEGFSSRSTVNRAYYAMFYAVLALLIRFDVEHKTSKHSGIISIFDREFFLAGRIESRYSKMLHNLFDMRQKADYKEMVELTSDDASKAVEQAQEFVAAIKGLIGTT